MDLAPSFVVLPAILEDHIERAVSVSDRPKVLIVPRVAAKIDLVLCAVDYPRSPQRFIWMDTIAA